MFHLHKAEPSPRTPVATALDAGATIQDAQVRRLRFERLVGPDERPEHVLEDRAPIAAVVGRRR